MYHVQACAHPTHLVFSRASEKSLYTPWDAHAEMPSGVLSTSHCQAQKENDLFHAKSREQALGVTAEGQKGLLPSRWQLNVIASCEATARKQPSDAKSMGVRFEFRL